MLSFSETFQSNLYYASTLNILEVIKFYIVGHKSFETDFNSQNILLSLGGGGGGE